MATMGTRRFWLPPAGGAPQQVLKARGYITIVLKAAYYNAQGSLWQRVFGGKTKITLTSEITYRYGADEISAAVILDSREVKANRSHFLGIAKTVALAVPADADGLQLKVELAAVESDHLDLALGMLSSNEFQKPLQLAPPLVGELAAITGLIKKTFSNVAPAKRLEASYPGIISETPAQDPANESRLCTGHLALISVHDEDDDFLLEIDPAKLALDGDRLIYDGAPLERTYVVYEITSDALRGLNPRAAWHRKLRQSYLKASELPAAATAEESARVWSEALALAREGAALLEEDPTYLASERDSIRTAHLVSLRDLRKAAAGAAAFALEALPELPGTTGYLAALAAAGQAASWDALDDGLYGGNQIAVLVDGKEAIPAIFDEILAAQRSVDIVGFDLDPTLSLAGRSLAEVLRGRAAMPTRVRVRVLVWVPIGLQDLVASRLTSHPGALAVRELRELAHALAGSNVSLEVRGSIAPFAETFAGQHQKAIVVDDQLAFVGGIDLTARRADDSEHVSPKPWHDVHLYLSGPAVEKVIHNFTQRWQIAEIEQRLDDVGFGSSPAEAYAMVRRESLAVGQAPMIRRAVRPREPASAVVRGLLFEDVRADIDRTFPAARERSILARYRQLLGAAQGFLYIENQYPFHSNELTRVLASTLRAEPGLHVVVVMPTAPDLADVWSPIEALVSGLETRRELARNLAALVAAGGGRLRLFALHGQRPIYVHSKILIMGSHVVVGSANLDELGMKDSSEIGAYIEDARLARSLLARLWREHLRSDMPLQLTPRAALELWDAAATSELTHVRRFDPAELGH